MHFDMHVYLLEKVLPCSFDSKTFAKFAPFLDPKMEVENGPKNMPEFDPQNEIQKCGTHVAIKIYCHLEGLTRWRIELC